MATAKEINELNQQIMELFVHGDVLEIMKYLQSTTDDMDPFETRMALHRIFYELTKMREKTLIVK